MSPTDVERAVRDAAPPALGVLLRAGVPFADAEDAMQDAVAIALEKWPLALPDRPTGWLVRVAQRRLIARYRTETARARREALVASWSTIPTDPVTSDDDSLALIVVCCHPALTPASAVPLTLRAVGGLTTREIADALLQPEATVAQRISRAKATIARSGERFGSLGGGELDDRLAAVLQIVYLIYNEGYVAATGADLTRPDLCDEAIRLARQLHAALPTHPEVSGLLALLLLTDARRPARTDDAGEVVTLDEQDRSRWDRARVTEGLRVLTPAIRQHQLGEYQLLASIAGLHDQAPAYEATDWARIKSLYDLLVGRTDNPVVALNRVVAIAHAWSTEEAWRELDALAAPLGDHHRYHAVRGDLWDLDGEGESARAAYSEAADRAANEPERRYLRRKACGPNR